MSDLARWAAWDGLAVMAIPLFLQITVVVGLAWVLDRLLGNRPAAARHAVWFCAMMMILIGPAFVLLMGRTGISLGTIRWGVDVAAVGGRAPGDPGATGRRPLVVPMLAERPTGRTTLARVHDEVSQGDSGGAATGGFARRPRIATLPAANASPELRVLVEWMILTGWLVGAIVLATRFVRGLLILSALRRSARPVHSDALHGVGEQVRAALGIGELPPISASPTIAGPVAIGIQQPTVILPDGWLGAIDDDALRDTLLHECAHIVRRDPLVGLLQRLVALIYWPHPLVHLLNRRLARRREEACHGEYRRGGGAAGRVVVSSDGRVPRRRECPAAGPVGPVAGPGDIGRWPASRDGRPEMGWPSWRSSSLC